MSWTGTAFTPPGCPANAVASYIVWYQVNNGAFVRWLDGVTGTSAQFNASSLGIGNGTPVGFRSQAIDIFGNRTPAGNATASTTISSSPPTVDMTALPTWTNTPNFTVSWTGNTQGGPAITTYNFEQNINNGGWQRLLSNTPQTSFQIIGAPNSNNYQFRAQASNNNGVSFGPWSSAVGTTIDVTAPTGTLNPLPQFTNSTSFWVSWTGTDNAGGSGVASYNVQYQIDGGGWQNLIQNTPQTSFYVQNAQTAQRWGFRIQAVDNAGNQQAWSSTAQAQTTILANPVAIVQNFNPNILQSTAPITDELPRELDRLHAVRNIPDRVYRSVPLQFRRVDSCGAVSRLRRLPKYSTGLARALVTELMNSRRPPLTTPDNHRCSCRSMPRPSSSTWPMRSRCAPICRLSSTTPPSKNLIGSC